MYEYVKGKIVNLTPTYVIIEVQGIGYHIHISLNTFTAIKDSREAKLFTHAVIRTETQSSSNMAMYGFSDEQERNLFLQLTSVSGVGNNTALLILSSYGPEELVSLIGGGDVASMQKIKGIGAKTAQRIIVDLKDTVGKVTGIKIKPYEGNTIRSESLSALLTLGFNRSSAEKALEKALPASDSDATVEQVIKVALGHLSS